jgi:hypothetical protein
MKLIFKKIFPWWFEDWEEVEKEKRKKLNNLFYKILKECQKEMRH